MNNIYPNLIENIKFKINQIILYVSRTISRLRYVPIKYERLRYVPMEYKLLCMPSYDKKKSRCILKEIDCWLCECGIINDDFKTICYGCQKSILKCNNKNIANYKINKENVNDNDTCVICLDQPKIFAITQCGHVCFCDVCGFNLDKCPICRTEYNPDINLIKIYFDNVYQKNINGNNNCVICMDQPKIYAITQCGHLCLCDVCGFNINKCPLCRIDYNPDINLIKIYL